MASVIDTGKCLCPICAGHYKEPRKLPGCSHSFCENCILSYVTNLKTDEKLGVEFECPVCRAPSKAPEKNNVTVEWVQTMHKNIDLKSEQDTEMSATISDCCSQCKYVNKATKSKIYCANCRDSFCEACSELLHSFKLNKDHVILYIEDQSKRFHNEAVKMLNKILTCNSHPCAPIEQYCVDDDALCCVYCVTSKHRLCANVKNICDMPRARENDEINTKEMLAACKTLSDHIQAVVNIIKTNETDVKKQSNNLSTDFQEMKQKVIRLLDVMENNLNQQCKSITKDISIRNLDEIHELQNIDGNTSTIIYLLENILDKVSPECAFICKQEVNKILQDAERKIVERGHLRSTEGVRLETEDIFDTVVNLGPNETTQLAFVERTVENLPLPKYTKSYSLRTDSITKAGFQHINASNDTYPAFMSLKFLPNNHLLLNDAFNGLCYMVDERNTLVAYHNFNVNSVKGGDTAYVNFICATNMKNGLIAVSVPLKKKICFITSNHANKDMELTCEMSCSKTPNAIHGLRNNDIAVLWDDPVAFGIIKIEAGSYTENSYYTQDKSGRILKSSHHMAIDETRSHVIQPCNVDNAVYCFDFDGNPVFKYTSAELRSPAGVAELDNQGDIFICERILSHIHVLSPTGKLLKLIKEDCPTSPLAIGFSRKGDRFAVSTMSSFDRVYFYSLETEEEMEEYED